MSVPIPPICLWCARLPGGTQMPSVCEAFPDGIPEPIIDGENDHSEPYPGDNGMTFLLKEGETYPSALYPKGGSS